MELITVLMQRVENGFIYRCPRCLREIRFCPKCGKPVELKMVDDVKREGFRVCPCPKRDFGCPYPEGYRGVSCPEQKPVSVTSLWPVPACVHCGHRHYYCVGCGGRLTGMGYALYLGVRKSF